MTLLQGCWAAGLFPQPSASNGAGYATSLKRVSDLSAKLATMRLRRLAPQIQTVNQFLRVARRPAITFYKRKKPSSPARFEFCIFNADSIINSVDAVMIARADYMYVLQFIGDKGIIIQYDRDEVNISGQFLH
jgi:hypothetical protein